MISLTIAFFSVILALWTRSFNYAKRVERTRRIYSEEGIEFPFKSMASVGFQILLHQKKFVESAENEHLREERIELCKDYISAVVLPLKRGVLVFGLLIPIEILVWVFIYVY